MSPEQERAEMVTYAEKIRVSRWHATYNAALTGMLSGRNPEEVSQAAMTAAAFVANTTHGKLIP